MSKPSNELKDLKKRSDNKALKRIAKGWPPARRKAQAERLRRSKIWLKSTGPKTKQGKAKSSQNSYKHGCRSKEAFEFIRVLRLQRAYLLMVEASFKKRRLPAPFSRTTRNYKHVNKQHDINLNHGIMRYE